MPSQRRVEMQLPKGLNLPISAERCWIRSRSNMSRSYDCGMRHRLVHGYYVFDYDLLWDMVTVDSVLDIISGTSV